MYTNIEQLQDAITIVKHFIERYGEHFNEFIGPTSSDKQYLFLDKKHAATAGRVFGTDGWVKKPGTGNNVSWVKEVDSVHVYLEQMENVVVDGAPVAPRAFPLELSE